MVRMFNKKGQAASTDALIFLSIVAVVFTMILGYGMNYGSGVMHGAENLYTNTYHYAALKAFMNASYGRDGNSLLHTKLQDSVATMIKEDYGANTSNGGANNQEKWISTPTKKAMFGILDEIFLPQSQRSYMLLITHQGSGNFPVPLIMLVKTREYSVSDNSETNLKYYICYFGSMNDVEKYLKIHSLGLEIVQSPFVLYKRILANGSGQDNGPVKEDADIYLASWITLPDINFFTVNPGKNDCNDFTNIYEGK